MSIKLKIIHAVVAVVFVGLAGISVWGVHQALTTFDKNNRLKEPIGDSECSEDEADEEQEDEERPFVSFFQNDGGNTFSAYGFLLNSKKLTFELDNKWQLERVYSGDMGRLMAADFSYTDTTQLFEFALNPAMEHPEYTVSFEVSEKEGDEPIYQKYIPSNVDDLSEYVEEIEIASLPGVKVLDMPVAPGWCGPLYEFEDEGFVYRANVCGFCTEEQRAAIEQEFEDVVGTFRLEGSGDGE